MSDLRGKRATVLGLGSLGGGVGVAKYLAKQGAHVTVTDMADAEALANSVRALEGLPVSWQLGGHEVRDFLPEGADFVVRNPGVRRDSKYLQIARDHGVPVEMEMSLFFRACPAPVIGVTGTKGKTTVSTLIGDMLKRWNPSSVVAGNMGISALAELERIEQDTPVVIELSSWQLEALGEHKLGPRIAVLTNIHEDHLTHYDGFDDYADTKRSIGANVPEDGVVVYNADQPETRRILDHTTASPMPFGLDDPGTNGAWFGGNYLIVRWSGREDRYELPSHLSLRGPAGIANALAACAAATARGVPTSAIAESLDQFAGVPDRLETVTSCNDVTFVNDTSATAPVAAAMSIRLLAEEPGQLIVLAGGTDKGSDFAPLADAIAETGVTIVLLEGSGTDRLRIALRERGREPSDTLGNLAGAFEFAVGHRSGPTTVLLSPGCASFGMFRNEFERGEQFRQLARAWCAEHGAPAV